jgi:hypothetical protein
MKTSSEIQPGARTEETVTQFTARCFATGPMCASPIEASDGILIGGVIVVRGEHEFGIVKAFLQAHCNREAKG